MTTAIQTVMATEPTPKKPTAFNLATTNDWDRYMKNRPPYPDSLFAKWLKFHGEDNPLNSIHDLGTGGGVAPVFFLNAIPRLMPDRPNPIKTFHLSDPGKTNIEAARRNLTPERFPGVRFTFHHGPGEERNPNFAPGSLDMVTACECLHFTDIVPTMAQVAASLRPGGTFASVVYQATPRIIGNPGAQAAQREISQLWDAELRRRGTGFAIGQKLQAGMALDFVPLDKNVFTDVVRWYCNVHNREWPFDHTLWTVSPEEIEEHRPRNATEYERNGGTEKEEVVTDLQDWGRRGVGIEKLRDFYEAMFPGTWDDSLKLAPWEMLEEEVRKAGGTVDIEYTVLMILARKK